MSISIILTTCNRPIEIVRRAVDSVLAQTLLTDTQLIIVNDYPRKENKFFYFFMYNHGYDLLLFNIEYIYNYLLISNNNNYNDVNFPKM